ncbi:hypothetical protein [Iningainema tapete]|uniref:Uncharacterized protein n=1 Tax=Iningainema tapete BLCC-T55 TaxID=2748662 RepID=A0A8J6XIF2_9CYAN|nr:hypothetical protein [Iningainema tapete]MBD2770797.1 hypothetical protein [Iningainema tapete BLCC-T55]
MRITTLSLVTILVLTSAPTSAQLQKQQTHNLTVTTEPQLESEKLLQISINQQLIKFNVRLPRVLEETQALKQFSTPYEAEFQRRNDLIRQNRDVQGLPRP